VLLLAIVSFGIPLGLALRDRVDSEVRSQARSQADVIAATAGDRLEEKDAGALADLALRQAQAVRGRVLIVDRAGVVVADSAGAGQVGASYAGRPEIAAALRNRTFQDERRSDTLDTALLATAVPIRHDGAVAGAVRITQDMEDVDDSVRSATLGLVLVAALVLAIGLAVGVVIARRLSAPLGALEGTAREIAAGDLERRAPVAGTEEQRSLARSFNEMTARLAGALRSQREFVADASHQLRTPLSGLRLRLEEARASRLPDDAAHEVDAALREIDRLSDTVDELLILSRAGERDAPAERLDLGELARTAAARWAQPAAERGMTVEVDAADGVAPAQAARADVERALELAEALDDRRATADAYFLGALVSERRGQWVAARSYAERAKVLYEEIDDRANTGKLLTTLGGLTFLLGRPDESIPLFKKAFAVALEVGSDADAAQAISSLAQVHLRTGQLELAEQQAGHALDLLADRVDFIDEIGNAQLVLGRSLLEQGRLEEAEEKFRAAEESFEQLSSASHKAAAWTAQAELAVRRGEKEGAIQLYQRAVEALQDFRF
jgi:signal transduction histidine kinase